MSASCASDTRSSTKAKAASSVRWSFCSWKRPTERTSGAVPSPDLGAEATRVARGRRQLDAVVDGDRAGSVEQPQARAFLRVRACHGDEARRAWPQIALEPREREAAPRRPGLVDVDPVHGVDDPLGSLRVRETREGRRARSVRMHDVWIEVFDCCTYGSRHGEARTHPRWCCILRNAACRSKRPRDPAFWRDQPDLDPRLR